MLRKPPRTRRLPPPQTARCAPGFRLAPQAPRFAATEKRTRRRQTGNSRSAPPRQRNPAPASRRRRRARDRREGSVLPVSRARRRLRRLFHSPGPSVRSSTARRRTGTSPSGPASGRTRSPRATRKPNSQPGRGGLRRESLLSAESWRSRRFRQCEKFLVPTDVVSVLVRARREHSENGICAVLVLSTPRHRRHVETDRRVV